MRKDTGLQWAHIFIQQWFSEVLGDPTDPQRQAWPSILAGKPTLISAPTGSGKTLSAFLVCIDDLLKKSLKGELQNKTEVLYVSPLKALSNDIQKNLQEPLEDIEARAKQAGHNIASIEVAVRTGDTPSSVRQKMLKKPPHILVTTPESLYILLTSEKSREMLKDIKTVIVDEIHALVGSKRGTHLALSLARLDALTHVKPLRIGLSATQKPIEKVAEFLTGPKAPQANIIHIGHQRPLEMSIELPNLPLGPVASNEMWDEIYDKIAEISKKYRSTLVFVNTRRLAERVAHHLAERLGAETVAAHHGSLSKKIRQQAETQLKQGQLSVLVATASLELGIDIGSIDLVCQIGSPRSISVALQRIGRSGHSKSAISKGVFFATSRDELFECAALIYAIRQKELDNLIFPKSPMDILAQQIVASCATQDWQEQNLYELIKSSLPYADLSRDTFEVVLNMLTEGIAGLRRQYGSYLFRDKVNGLIKAKRGARITAITNGGAIPENGLFTMVALPENVMIGTLDEDFAVESNRGDVILLGTTSWQIQSIEAKTGTVFVEDAKGAPPSVPFWRGEAPGRTQELSEAVSFLRETLDKQFPDPRHLKNVDSGMQANNKAKATDWLKNHCGVNDSGAQQMLAYLVEGRAVLGAVPSNTHIIAERFFDEAGGMQLILHAPFGMRINKAWGLALRKKFCTNFNFELQASATDNGINISLTEQHSFPLSDVFHFLHPNTLTEVLTQAVLQSPLFTTRWRWTATRSLALPRYRSGKKLPPNIQRMMSDDLLAAVFPDAAACQDNLAGKQLEPPDHPLVNETMKDALTEALDIEGLTALLEAIKSGKITCTAIDTSLPSVFSAEILNANPYSFLDDAPLEERRARAVSMRRLLPESLLQEAGKLDPLAIQEVQKMAWPDIRSADELQDVLHTLIGFPLLPDFNNDLVLNRNFSAWIPLFEELKLQGRGSEAVFQNTIFWVTTERKAYFQSIYPEAVFKLTLKDIEVPHFTSEDALEKMLQGWMLHLGPSNISELSRFLKLSASTVEASILKIESSGMLLRGHFLNESETEWCERRLLARIHKITLDRLRQEIEAVQPQEFMRWLCTWQHLAGDATLAGEAGLMALIRKLQGFEMPAQVWETQIFSKRIKDYSRDLLDKLCLMGKLRWCRMSSHPSSLSSKTMEAETETVKKDNSKKLAPSRIAPITFLIREETQEIFKPASPTLKLSPVAQAIYEFLQKQGASFFSEITQGIKRLPYEVEKGLWELVALAVITADSFDNLRGLIDPKRRLKRRPVMGWDGFSAGRWSLVKRQNDSLADNNYLMDEVEKNKNAEAWCKILLKRYGVVFRDLLVKERNIPRWRDLLQAFRRMEERAEIRGGRFVSGFSGEQFALPEVVSSLRAVRQKPVSEEIISISAADPLNLIGILLPGARFHSLSRKTISIKNGHFLLPEVNL